MSVPYQKIHFLLELVMLPHHMILSHQHKLDQPQPAHAVSEQLRHVPITWRFYMQYIQQKKILIIELGKEVGG